MKLKQTLRLNSHIKRGTKALSQGDFQEARKEFKMACELDPKNDGAWYHAGDLEFRAGNYDRAHSHLSEAIRLNQKNATYYELRAKCCEARKKYDCADKDYLQASKIDPSYKNHLDNARKTRVLDIIERGIKALNQGNVEAGRKEFEMACKIDPKSDEAWYRAGALELRVGNLTLAHSHLSHAIGLNQKNVTYYVLRAKCCEAQKQYGWAEGDYRKALILDPANKKNHEENARRMRILELQGMGLTSSYSFQQEQKPTTEPDKDGRLQQVRLPIYLPNAVKVVSNDRILLGGFKGDLALLDSATFRIIQSFRQHGKWVERLDAFPDGRFVSGSQDGMIKVWDPNGKCLLTISEMNHLEGLVAIAPNRIISGHRNCIKVWDSTSGNCLKTLDGGVASIFKLDENRIIVGVGSEIHQAKYQSQVLDATSLNVIKTIDGIHGYHFFHMADGNVLAVGKISKSLGLVLISSDKFNVIKKHNFNLQALFRFPATTVGNYLICTSENNDETKNTIYIIDVNSGVIVKSIPKAHPAIRNVSQEIKCIFALPGDKITTISMTEMQIWDCKSLLPEVTQESKNIKDKQYWVSRGNELYQNKDYRQAMNAYDNALNLDKKYVPAMVGRASVLYSTREFYDSYYLFRDARIADSSNLQAWYGEILSLLEVNSGMAEESVRDALKRFPNDKKLLEYQEQLKKLFAKQGPSVIDQLQAMIDEVNSQHVVEEKKQEEERQKEIEAKKQQEAKQKEIEAKKQQEAKQKEIEAKKQQAAKQKEIDNKKKKVEALMKVAESAFEKYDLKAGRKALEQVLNVDLKHKKAKELLERYSPHKLGEKDKLRMMPAMYNERMPEVKMYLDLATNKDEIFEYIIDFVIKKGLTAKLVGLIIEYGYAPKDVNALLLRLLDNKQVDIFNLVMQQSYKFILEDHESLPDKCLLYVACKKTSRKIIEIICDKYKINDHHWWMAFQACVDENDGALAKFMVKRFPNGVNQSYNGTSLLIHAAALACNSVVEVLLDMGADTTTKCTNKVSEFFELNAKQVAEKLGYSSIVDEIKKYETPEQVDDELSDMLSQLDDIEPKKTGPVVAAKPKVSTQNTDPEIDTLLSGLDEVSVGTTSSSSVNSLNDSKIIAPEEEVIPEPQKPKQMKYQKIKWADVQQGELIGNGGFGKVYKGKWQSIDVAIKTLHKEVLEKPELAAFEREAEIMSICRHPNIVVLHGACDENGHYALILEFMPRKSLYDLHRREENLPWYPQRWQIALDICHAMSYLHCINIIHRDLKSLNVLIDEHFRAKVSDFGMAKVKTDSSSSNQSAAPKLGTARWRAPEMISPDKPTRPNKLTDIYALGLVLWELYSQKVPFHEAQDEMTIMFWLFQGKQIEIGDDCPKLLKEIIRLCTSKEPTMRPHASLVAKHVSDGMADAKKTSNVANAKSWHFDSTVKSHAKLSKEKPYVLLEAGPSDIEKVIEYYSHHPVPGMDVGRVQIIYNPKMNRKFVLRLSELQERDGNPAFNPKWHAENFADWRKAVNQACANMAVPHYDSNFPAVKIVPLWHGTKTEILDSIFRTGFANLATTDAGFFGKGIYSAHEAEYSFRVYSNGALILNWVSFYSAYPVVDGDMSKLTNKANYSNYDAHFVPVVPASDHPDEVNYFPTKLNQKPKYHEVVVFDSAQCLPRYIVHLSKNVPIKGLMQFGLFNQQVGAINLLEVIRFVYRDFLSKSYDLVMVDEVDWSMMDWQLSHAGKVVPRPNHGLVHTMRSSSYVSFVVQYYLDQHENKMSAKQVGDLKRAVPWLQLCMLFFVAARRNEIGFHHNPVVYQGFRVACGEALKHFLISKGCADKQAIDYFSDAVVNCYSKDDPVHRILRICHDLDLMRCIDSSVYKNKLAGISAYLGDEHTNRLSHLVLRLLEYTGDRIMADNLHLRHYQLDQFVICSTDIDRCLEQIESGVRQWQTQEYGVKAAVGTV